MALISAHTHEFGWILLTDLVFALFVIFPLIV